MIAGLTAFVVLPVTSCLMINDPKAINATIDNKQSPAATKPEIATGLSLRDALHERSFWVLTCAFILLGAFTMGLTVNLMPMLIDRGIEPFVAARALSTIGVSLIVGRIVTGFLLDRFPAPLVAFGCLTLSSLGVFGLAIGLNDWILFVSVGLVGFGIGAEFDLMSYFISRYFGHIAYGKIYGTIYGAFQFGGSMGMILMANIFDWTGVYNIGVWILFAGVLSSSALFAFLGPQPIHKKGN